MNMQIRNCLPESVLEHGKSKGQLVLDGPHKTMLDAGNLIYEAESFDLVFLVSGKHRYNHLRNTNDFGDTVHETSKLELIIDKCKKQTMKHNS